MAAIVDLSDLVNRMTGGSDGNPENIFFYKDTRVGGSNASSSVLGRYHSLWQFSGSPSHGATPPTSPEVPTNSTPGSLRHTNPGGGRQKWMTAFCWGGLCPGTVILYDRLLHISGLSGTSTSPQTVGGSITRNTGGVGNEIWIEIYTTIGTTASTINANYVNQDGNPATTVNASIGAVGLRESQRVIRLNLAAGDTGVQSVTDVTLVNSTGTVGNFGVTIARPLVTVTALTQASLGNRNLVSGFPAMMSVDTDACLAMCLFASLNGSQIICDGSIHFVEA